MLHERTNGRKMAYMSMEEQIASHLEFLRRQHFVIEELHMEKGFIRCRTSENEAGRGEVC
jgi:hypothetical protein